MLARVRGGFRNVAANDAQGGPSGGGSGNLRDRFPGASYEGGFFEEIGRRITTHRQLRKQDDLRPGRPGLPREVDDFLCIPLEIPYRRVDLGESNLHFFSLSTVESADPEPNRRSLHYAPTELRSG